MDYYEKSIILRMSGLGINMMWLGKLRNRELGINIMGQGNWEIVD